MNSTSNRKRVQILATGKTLFWKYGFKRVTIEEICREAGVSKMTFYKFFSNKMELVQTILDKIYEDSFTAYRNIMESDLPYPEKVLQTIHLKREGTKDISNEFFQDYMTHADPEMNAYFEKVKQKSIQMVTDDFATAQKAGDIRQDVKVEFIIQYLNHMIEMTFNENLVALYANPQEMLMELVNFFFYGVMPRK